MAPTGKGPLRTAIEDWIDTSGIGQTIRGWFTKFFEMIEYSIVGEYKELLDQLSTIPSWKKLFDPSKFSNPDGRHQGGIFSLIGMGSAIGSGAASSLFAPLFRKLNYSIDKNEHSARLDPPAWLEMLRRQENKAIASLEDLYELGWTDQRIAIMMKANERQLDPSQVIQLYLRGEISKQQADIQLYQAWVSLETADQLYKLANVIPNVGDLISMAVREAWDDSTSAQFQYDTELPAEAASWAAKQGLSQDWFKRYWRAHWQLPSVGQGYEMLHRLRPGTTSTPFTMDDMKRLMKTADYPVFFRDRMIAVSYSPYTRVDVRRMYGLGVLTAEQVKAAYMDLGYDEEHAQNLADFTVKYEDDDGGSKRKTQQELTSSLLEQAYRKGIITMGEFKDKLKELRYLADDIETITNLAEFKRQLDLVPYEYSDYQGALKNSILAAYEDHQLDKSTAKSMLVQISYTSQDAEWMIAVSDFDRLQADRAGKIANLKEGYVSRELTRQEVISGLGSVNVSGSEQSNLLGLWDNLRDTRTGKLTQAQYKSALDLGVITLDQYLEELRGLGLSEKSVTLMGKIYTFSLTEEEQQAAQDAAIAAQKAAQKADEAAQKAAQAARDLAAKQAAADAKQAAKEAEAEQKALTEAQNKLTAADISKAFKQGLIDQSTAIKRLVAIGYNEENALIYLQVHL